MNRTQTVGLLSELAFTKRCIELGLEVLAPIGVERYDLVIVLGGEFQRVQVKTGLYRNGAITFATSSNAEGVGRPRSYDGDADLIGVYAQMSYGFNYFASTGNRRDEVTTMRLRSQEVQY